MSKKTWNSSKGTAKLALSAVCAHVSAHQTDAGGKDDDKLALIMPDLTTGNVEEKSSLAMNGVITDIEAKYDAIYLNYPRHKQMQIAIDRIRMHGRKVKGTGTPMRGLLVTGPTGSGKTTGIVEYVAHLIREGAYSDGRMPVLYIRLRKKITVLKLLRAILAKFGERYLRQRDEDEMIAQVRNCIERAGVEVIIIDEAQHLRNKSTDNLEVTDQLKTFLDDCIAPVVFVGVREAKEMIEENLQLAGRFADPVELAPLNTADKRDVELLTEFLRRLDEQMVALELTKQRSSLNAPYIVTCLHLACGGIIGQAYRIVRAALLIAISRGGHFIEAYDLSLAVERWAIKIRLCVSNPFLHADLRAAHGITIA
ncbi:TniB family NTP-binding protein [Sphingomonas xinjiangensis]|uniref:Nucleoside-triphosphatase THEP1 n=1 Tax=Sphingomonas xinjiangensis TaxID=643568 RepID=A0A840YRM6_9SPHN|nr:TniB family NTP-binding protein [Sphingomonas xinjiangensis]MBB5711873.1 nucleoside-triphosphatase THEP1 [Sphingomonas xinjiangensis]